MMENTGISKRGDMARETALLAAVKRFSCQSYEQVGLRQVAADAGLDVARVHRLFGSKEALFEASVRRAFDGWQLAATDGRSLARELAEGLMGAREAPDGDALQMVVRSVSDPHAAPILRAWCQDSFLEPVARIISASGRTATPAETAERAALLAACCFGIAVMRQVMMVPALAEPQTSALPHHIEQLLTCALLVDGPVHPKPELLEPAS